MRGPVRKLTLYLLQAWKQSPPSLKIQAERSFDCCGLGLNTSSDPQVNPVPSLEDMKWSIDNHVFDHFPTAKCFHAPSNGTIPPVPPPGCLTCYSLISDKVRTASLLVKPSSTNLSRSTLGSMVRAALVSSSHSQRLVSLPCHTLPSADCQQLQVRSNM